MRYLIPLLLMCSLAGYTQAQEQQQLNQLPSGTSEIQVRGQTFYQHGDTYYRFHPQGGYYYEVQPPQDMSRSDQAHFYRRNLSDQHPNVANDVERGCRNQAADQANRNPANGGKIYIREFNRCINMATQNR
ncbi:hypothetical protein [Microbulbifer halophilus]|uniref:Uncharacterized protein n=1 Tax=Microbulbifer halophilus TaxID=453963 RepID=A0ABW5E9I8_9GAMM|nr:hypothetical protein [Microbulbifer halophilus]MCW8126150.1 hypothetical protein [Microbulbifer halophilus]